MSDLFRRPQIENILMYVLNRAPFPIYAFTPLVNMAINEGIQTIKAPHEVIVASILTNISLACQDKFDIERHGIVSPPSLNLLLAAESGERKSACDTVFQTGIRRYEAQELAAAKPRWAAYQNKLLIWNVKLKQKTQELQQCVVDGKATNELEAQMIAIQGEKPDEPKVPRMLVSDTTSEALDLALFQWPSVGLISDEGGVIFSSGAIRNLGKLNQCWDGKPLRIDRKTSPSFIVSRPRLTVSIMAQPAIVSRFKDKNGQQARHIGMLARFLVAYPVSTQGYRITWGEPPKPEHVPKFNDRIFEILNRYQPDQQVAPEVPVLKLSPEALHAWQYFCNAIESDLREGELLFDVKDAASKMGENAVRLAGLLHYFEGFEGDVSLDTFERARTICAWYLKEFKQLFGVQPAVAQDWQDAQSLENYFSSHQFARTPDGYAFVDKNVIRQKGPNQLRGKSRLDAALAVLALQNKIFIGNRHKTQVVFLNTNYFGTPGISQ